MGLKFLLLVFVSSSLCVIYSSALVVEDEGDKQKMMLNHIIKQQENIFEALKELQNRVGVIEEAQNDTKDSLQELQTKVEAIEGMAVIKPVQTPSISLITKEQVVDIGSSTQLECTVENAQDYPVVWRKRGSTGSDEMFISTGSSVIISDPRYTLRLKHDKESATYILQVKDIQESDLGDYMCQVILGLNNITTATVKLLVGRPPVISDNFTSSVVAMEGASVTLSCYADGMPLPDISWRREYNALLATGGSIYRGNVLQIINIRNEDRGTYYCIAENQVGKGDRRNVKVEVEFAPVVKASRPKVYQAIQYDMVLECLVEAYPPAAITWIHNQEAIVNSEHHSISQFTSADEFTDTTLRVFSIEKQQFGNYTCMAINKLGRSEAIVTLIESTMPVCPPACGP